MIQLGADNGANIQITSSIFSYTRLCKGTIVYRPGSSQNSIGLLNYQLESGIKSICDSCQILIENTIFNYINFNQQIRALRPLYDQVKGQRLSQRLDSSGLQAGSVMTPLFQNYGSVLNIEDFNGPIELSNSNVQNSMVYIPDLQYSTNDTATRTQYNQLEFYRDSNQNNYQTGVCQQNVVKYRLMNQGISNIDPDDLFTIFERYQTIYISRPKFPVIFNSNSFSNNIGLFGGAITINSPDFSNYDQNGPSSKKAYIITQGNTFSNNMAYLSGSALYVRMTRIASQNYYFCGALTMIGDTLTGQFGTKISSGTISVVCETVSDQFSEDYFHSSGFTDNGFDNQVSDQITDYINSNKFYQPYRIRNFFGQLTMSSNFVGRKGTAIYLKHVSALIQSSTFSSHGAVDSYQERIQLPAYTRFLIGLTNGVPNRLFTYDQVCGSSEFNYLQQCQTATGLSVYESQVQGTIYYEGSGLNGVFASVTVQESLSIRTSTFTMNSVGIPFFSSSLASNLYILNSRLTNIQFSTFQMQSGSISGYRAFVSSIANSLSQFYPPMYFGSSLAPMVNIVYNQNAQTIDQNQIIFFDNCTFQNTNNFQILTSVTNKMPNTYEGSLISFYDKNPNINTIVTLNQIIVQGNYVIGQASLIYFYGAAQILVTQSTFQQNGALSFQDFNTAQVQVNSMPQLFPVQINLSQQLGVFQVVNCTVFNPATNKFSFNAAKFGTAFTLNQTMLYSQSNSFSYHIAFSGAIAQIFGSGLLQTFSESDSITFTIGTAFVISILDDLHVSQTTFRFLSSQDAANEDVGLFYLSKVGAFCLYQCQITSSQSSGQGQINVFVNSIQNFSALDQNYLYSRMGTFNSQAGVVKAINSYYASNLLTMTYLTNVYQISAQTKPSAMWFYNNQITNQFGILSGVALIQQQSQIYFSTSDGQYVSPNLFRNRLLQASQFQISSNNASAGAGVIAAQQFSQVSMSGCNFQGNFGLAGGIVQLLSSTLSVAKVTAIGNYGTYGGFLFSQNSYYNIDTSQFSSQNSSQASFLFSTGFRSDLPNSYIGNVFIDSNQAKQDTMVVVQGFVTLNQTYFQDNYCMGGANGFSSIGSVITANAIIARQTFQVPSNQIFAESGFIIISYQSSLSVRNSRIQNQQGTMAGAILNIGNSILNITNTDISKNQVLFGAIISIVRSQSTNFQQLTMNGNQGGPSVQLTGSQLVLLNSTLQGTKNTLLFATRSNVTAVQSVFQNGGSFDGAGGAIYCDCQNILISGCQFTTNIATSGGAIHIIGRAPAAQKIYSNQFTNNQAQQGGAITVVTADLLDISGNSFTNNQAYIILPSTVASDSLPSQRAQGGAIFSLCQDTYNQNCKVLIQGNTFNNNSAQNEGASFIYMNTPPQLNSGQPNIYTNNSATYGGNGVSGFATNLQIVSYSNNDPLQPNATLKKQAITLSNFNVVSGVSLSFLINLVDQFGNILTAENQATAIFRVQAVNYNKSVSLEGAQAIANNGVFNFTGFLILTEPGISFIMELIIVLPYSSSSRTKTNTINQIINVNVRSCGRGETFTAKVTCQACPIGTFNLIPRYQVHECEQCFNGALCFGLDKLAPMENYWRENINSVNILKCFNNQACLGGNQTEVLGNCAANYGGVQCSVCNSGYYQSGSDHRCLECPSTSTLVFILLPIFGLGLGVVIVGLTTFNSRYGKFTLNFTPALIKIWIIHTQIVWFFWMIQRWSSNQSSVIRIILSMQTIFDNYVEQYTKCWLHQTDLSENWTSYLRYFWTFAPLGILLIAITLITLLLTCLHKNKLWLTQVTQVFSITIFVCQMRTIFRLTNTFNCVSVLGQRLLEEDRSQVCFDQNHVKIMIFSGFAIAFWAGLLPLIQFFTLFLNRLRIMRLIHADWQKKPFTKEQVQELKASNLRYNVVINGYCANQFYYDQAILIKSFLLCVIYVSISAVYFNKIYLIMLALVIFMLICLIFEVMIKPYQYEKLNYIQFSSTVAIAGLFFSEMVISVYQDLSETGTNLIMVVSILFVIVPHLLFYTLLLSELKQQVLWFCYHRSFRLFKVITFGLVSPELFALKNKLTSVHRTPLDQTEISRLFGRSFKVHPEQDLKTQETDRDGNQIIRPEEVLVTMEEEIPQTGRIDSQRAFIDKRPPSLKYQENKALSEYEINQEIEEEVQKVVKQKSTRFTDSKDVGRLTEKYERNRPQLQISTKALKSSLAQPIKTIIQEEAVQPESSSYTEETGKKGDISQDEQDDRGLSRLSKDSNDYLDVKLATQQNGEIDASFMIQGQIPQTLVRQNNGSRSAPVLPAGVQGQLRQAVESAISMEFVKMKNQDADTRPPSQMSETSPDKIEPQYPNFTTDKQGLNLSPLTPPRGSVQFVQGQQSDDKEQLDNSDLPRFGSQMSQNNLQKVFIDDDARSPQSKMSENIGQSPVKLTSRLTVQFKIDAEAPPIRTTTKRKFV